MTASERALAEIAALGYPMIEARPLTRSRAARYAPDGADYEVVCGEAADEAEATAALMYGVASLLGERTGLLVFRVLPEIALTLTGATYYARLRLIDWPAPEGGCPFDRLRIEEGPA